MFLSWYFYPTLEDMKKYFLMIVLSNQFDGKINSAKELIEI